MTDTSSVCGYNYQVKAAPNHGDGKNTPHHSRKRYADVSRHSSIPASRTSRAVLQSATSSCVRMIAMELAGNARTGWAFPDVIEGHLSSSMAWLKEAANTITSFSTNQSAESPTIASCSSAEMVLERLHVANLKPSRIVGTVEAGIMFYFFAKSGMAAIECFDTGDIAFLVQKLKSKPRAWDVYPEVFPLHESVMRLADFVSAGNYEQLLAAP